MYENRLFLLCHAHVILLLFTTALLMRLQSDTEVTVCAEIPNSNAAPP